MPAGALARPLKRVSWWRFADKKRATPTWSVSEQRNSLETTAALSHPFCHTHPESITISLGHTRVFVCVCVCVFFFFFFHPPADGEK